MSKHHYTKHRPLFSSNVPEDVKHPKTKWKILPWMWLGFKRMCFVLGLSMFLSALIGVYSASMLQEQAAPSLPKDMVLYVEFAETMRELPKEASFAEPFGQNALTVRQMIATLDKAASDPRVRGLLARMNDGAFSITHVEEVREAVKRFRASGKFAYIYSSSYGGAAGGLGRYYLASAFDEIWMQPLGIITIAGVKAEVPFLRPVLDKIGVTPNFFQREDYKTAYESLTSKEMSKENRETLTNIVSDIRDVVMKDLPEERGKTMEEFAALIDQGLLTAQEAKAAGLITHMDYADVLVDSIEMDVAGETDPEPSLFVGLKQYSAKVLREKHDGLVKPFGAHRPRVALIYAVGAIMDSADGGGSPGFDTGVAAANEIAAAIMEAEDDDQIETIILRIDSPGGSPVASERILRAIENAKKKGKKIVVSMGATAASGGYWIAAYADYIFAMPTTLTGSIGVVGGKFSAGDMMDKIGVNWDSVQWGENAGIWSFNTPFSKTESERINAMLDAVYDAFLERVSKGRNMSVEEVRKIAGGRVWSGTRALEVGLVDQLGGFYEVLNYVAELEGVDDPAKMDVVVLPQPKSPLEQFIELLVEQGAVYETLRVQSSFLKIFEPYAQQLSVLGSGEGALTYKPIRIE